MKNLEVNKKLLQKVMKTGTAFVLAGTLLMGSNMVLPTIKNNSAIVSAEEANLVNLNVQMGVNLYMNDKGFIPRDVNGNETYPFIYEGTTYVPIRAIAELFNASVNWDASSNTVSIVTSGEKAKLNHTNRPTQTMYNMNITASKGTKLVVNGQEIIPTDVNGNIKDIYVVKGTTYVPVRAISTALGLPITWSDLTNSVFIGRHKTEGLTVENINDLEAIEEAKWQFFPYTPTHWGYYYGDGKYNILEEGNDRKEFAMYIALLNWEYITDETLVSMLPNLNCADIERMISSLGIFVYNFYDSGDHYNWQYVTVDEENGKFLDNLEMVCTEDEHEVLNNLQEAAKLIYDFYDINCQEYEELRTDLTTLFFVNTLINNTRYYRDTEYNDQIREISKHNREQFGMPGTYFYKNELIKTFEDRYFKALENQNQKQLSYN